MGLEILNTLKAMLRQQAATKAESSPQAEELDKNLQAVINSKDSVQAELTKFFSKGADSTGSNYSKQELEERMQNLEEARKTITDQMTGLYENSKSPELKAIEKVEYEKMKDQPDFPEQWKLK